MAYRNRSVSMRIGFLSDMTQLRLALEIAVDDSEPRSRSSDLAVRCGLQLRVRSVDPTKRADQNLLL